MRSEPLWLSLVLAAVLSVGCGPSVPEPVVEGLEPRCGDRAATTAVTVRGMLPVQVVVAYEGSEPTLDSTYQAWVGTTELNRGEVGRCPHPDGYRAIRHPGWQLRLHPAEPIRHQVHLGLSLRSTGGRVLHLVHAELQRQDVR